MGQRHTAEDKAAGTETLAVASLLVTGGFILSCASLRSKAKADLYDF